MTGANIDALTDNPADIIKQLDELNAVDCKLIRWQLVNDIYAMANWTTDQYDWWLNNRLWVLDQCIGTILKNAQPVIIDFHHPVGGMKVKGRTAFFYDDALMRHHILKVCQVAERYKHHPGVFAIEPVNEPFPRSDSQLNQFYRDICGAIRATGFDKHIVLGHATAQIDKMSDLRTVPFNNIWYSAHIWPSYCLQANASARTFSKTKIKSLLSPFSKWESRNRSHLASTNSRMLLGEFGCHKESGKSKNQTPYLANMRDVLNGWSWCDWLWHSHSHQPYSIWHMNSADQFNNLWRT